MQQEVMFSHVSEIIPSSRYLLENPTLQWLAIEGHMTGRAQCILIVEEEKGNFTQKTNAYAPTDTHTRVCVCVCVMECWIYAPLHIITTESHPLLTVNCIIESSRTKLCPDTFFYINQRCKEIRFPSFCWRKSVV